MKRIVITIVVALCIIIAGAIQTSLHAKQRNTKPAADAAVSTSPTEAVTADAS